jgi:DAK2 domain fusion protein YloV
MPQNTIDPQFVDSTKIVKYQSINGQVLKELFNAGILWVKTNQQTINSLNVFPVPDGDTGTNMFLTLKSAYSEVSDNNEQNIGRIARLISQGALMGARGNSGVILSQLLRGFARVLDDQPEMDAQLFIQALNESRNTAYKGVVRPVEGTILTVAKDIAQAAENAFTISTDLAEILTIIIKEADKSVQNTPNLLPILKQAGVVDSGGKGLYFFLEGMQRFINNLPLELEASALDINTSTPVDKLLNFNDAIEPGQDFEIVVDFTPTNPLDLKQFYAELSEIGTSIQLGEGENLYRMHIHTSTANQYLPLEYVKKYGTIKKVYIENLLEQIGNQHEQNEISKPSIKEGQIAVIAVSPGKGITKIFQSLGVAAVVEGGQTMNPSTEELLDSFKDLPTSNIIILPNNKNIILAAETAKSATHKNVIVIPSKSVPQGLSACLHLDPDGDFDSICKEMKDAIGEVETGEITIATRSITINNVKVNKGEIIALHNGVLVDSSKSLKDTCINLLKLIGTEKMEHITIFSGQNITKLELEEIIEFIKTSFPKQEIEVHDGGQPLYQFIFAVE